MYYAKPYREALPVQCAFAFLANESGVLSRSDSRLTVRQSVCDRFLGLLPARAWHKRLAAMHSD